MNQWKSNQAVDALRCVNVKLATSPDALLALAPTALHNGRVRRYHGDDVAVNLGSLDAADQELTVRLYEFVLRLFHALRGADPEREWAFRHLLDNESMSKIASEISRLGLASVRNNPDPAIAKAMHDIRGGGLTPILGQLQLCELGIFESSDCESLFFLARDHLKIMRNAMLGLDDVKRSEDLHIKIHSSNLIVEKWDGIHIRAGGRDILVTVNSAEDAAISECCVEFGALDRILYNLLNNACRHSASDEIELFLFPTGAAENLRFVLLNALTDEEISRLQASDLQSLFRPGVSTTGSGYGLSVVAEFVANAFGLATPEDAVIGSYVGAEIIVGKFAVWFHWPIVADYTKA
jgi:signal transduction histidine kinase